MKNGIGMKVVLDENFMFGMKVVLDELVFYRLKHLRMPVAWIQDGWDPFQDPRRDHLVQKGGDEISVPNGTPRTSNPCWEVGNVGFPLLQEAAMHIHAVRLHRLFPHFRRLGGVEGDAGVFPPVSSENWTRPADRANRERKR